MGRQAISYVPEKYKFYFDTRNHWTKPYVEKARQRGIMTGYNDYFFGPENSLTRGQAAVILDRILDPEQKQAKMDLSYTDISKHFGYKSILRLSNAGYMSGYPDGTFKPNGKITRAQLAAILNKIYPAQTEAAEKNFTDVKPGFWAYDAIQNIQAQGLINGDSAGSYRPDSPLKRGEMAVILDRLSNR
nr:S-layer homology domain-containing protein [Cytobacillus sp. NCCP-133]